MYSFGVIPSEISPENRKHILGAQANLWTEYIPTYDKVEYMEYPRALAMSQNLWSLDKGSYEDFVKAIVEKQSSVSVYMYDHRLKIYSCILQCRSRCSKHLQTWLQILLKTL